MYICTCIYHYNPKKNIAPYGRNLATNIFEIKRSYIRVVLNINNINNNILLLYSGVLSIFLN